MTTPPVSDRCTQRLRHHMARQNLPSFRQLAQQAGVSPATIRQLRAGQAARCRGETLAKIAIALDLTVDQLLTECSELPLTRPTPAPAPMDPSDALHILEPWLLQWPTVVAAVTKNPDLPASKIIPLVKPLERLLDHWQVKAIAPIGSEQPYDPTIHELMDGTATPGAIVRIRYAGYYHGEALLYRAKVSPVAIGSAQG
ncbi:helix-turn-helix domain-containing protein [Spirulina major]|uniref:helix-turn-helix domain-containing protein n=1 Tax=Spirulina major TaxID=270636 RepID=UPI000933FB67|nr:helix-turn-helix domain-containing protein [Spirulina major]